MAFSAVSRALTSSVTTRPGLSQGALATSGAYAGVVLLLLFAGVRALVLRIMSSKRRPWRMAAAGEPFGVGLSFNGGGEYAALPNVWQ